MTPHDSEPDASAPTGPDHDAERTVPVNSPGNTPDSESDTEQDREAAGRIKPEDFNPTRGG